MPFNFAILKAVVQLVWEKHANIFHLKAENFARKVWNLLLRDRMMTHIFHLYTEIEMSFRVLLKGTLCCLHYVRDNPPPPQSLCSLFFSLVSVSDLVYCLTVCQNDEKLHHLPDTAYPWSVVLTVLPCVCVCVPLIHSDSLLLLISLRYAAKSGDKGCSGRRSGQKWSAVESTAGTSFLFFNPEGPLWSTGFNYICRPPWSGVSSINVAYSQNGHFGDEGNWRCRWCSGELRPDCKN